MNDIVGRNADWLNFGFSGPKSEWRLSTPKSC
jgi:hypothetical protein